MGMELKERKVLSKRTVSKTAPLEGCDDEKHISINGKEVEGRMRRERRGLKEKRISIVLWLATSLD